jgi:teichuronic acid biosynthesis glycosyltransferase TuaH
LLQRTAEECKEIRFVLVGPQKVRIPYALGDNIVFLGSKDYTRVPFYIGHCSFGIIPFKNNDLVRYVSPIKMYEFLSLGKPIVSVAWDELRELNAPIHLASDLHEFISLIKQLAQNQDIFPKEELVNFAMRNTWESRYKLILERLGVTFDD